MLRTPKGCATRGGSLASRIERCRAEALDLFSRHGYRPFCASSWRKRTTALRVAGPAAS